MSWTKPMLTLAATLTSQSLDVRFDQTKLGTGPVTLNVTLTDGTYRNDLSTSSGLIGHLITRLNAAETAAGTDGAWAASNPSGIYRAQVRLTRTPGSASDDVKDIRYSTLSTTLRGLLGIDSTNAAPTGAGVAGATCTWTTRHLGHVWTPDRHPLRDYSQPIYGGALASNGAGYGVTIIDRVITAREVVLELVPGGLVLSDIFERLEGWRMISGLSSADTSAPLEVLWGQYTGAGTAQPNDTLRYYPDRDTPATYQDVRLTDPAALLRPFAGGLGEETIPSPSRWRLRFPLERRY